MNHLGGIINRHLDKAAIGFTLLCATVVTTEAYTRTSLQDAQTAKECRYPSLSSILTAAHVQELETNGMVVIKNVLTPSQLDGARREVKLLGDLMDTSNHQNADDVRQDQVCLVRESDENDHGDDIIHCIKLLRGIPYILNRFDYATSSSFVVPHQCQLARYLPDGSIYVRHLDKCTSGISEMGLIEWLRASDYRYRAVTAILYLNSPHWENNGVLRCFESKEDGNRNSTAEQENYVDVDPVGGTMVLFDSARVEPQVQPSTEDRYALTLWINGVMKEPS